MEHFEKKEGSDTHNHEHKRHEHHVKHEHHKPVHHEHKSEKKPKKKSKLNFWKLSTIVLLALLIINVFTGYNFNLGGLSKEEAGTHTLDFVNQELLQDQSVAELVSVSEENGLYNLKLSVSGQSIDSYVTKDGEIFFPQAIKISDFETESGTTGTTPAPVAELTKSAVPKVDLYVMSHCPYGTQAEKGILPVVNLLGDKIDFELKFVNYAMHGQIELDEQLNQYCIQKEQNDVFNDYLECFLSDGKGESCLASTGVDTAKMESCVTKADKEFKVTELYEDQTSWRGGKFPQFNTHDGENVQYGVQGSPTLIINGVKPSSTGTSCSTDTDCTAPGESCADTQNGKFCMLQRSPSSYLGIICAAFENAPKECTESTGVSSEPYQPGFGYEAGAATAASCG